jgi:hypothetical protein
VVYITGGVGNENHRSIKNVGISVEVGAKNSMQKEGGQHVKRVQLILSLAALFFI